MAFTDRLSDALDKIADQHLDEVRTLRARIAELEARQVPGWQPIETAPDDCEFLAYRRGVIRQCGWRQSVHGDEVIGGLGWSFPEDDLPTHWMPLPAAPSPADSGEVKPCSNEQPREYSGWDEDDDTSNLMGG